MRNITHLQNEKFFLTDGGLETTLIFQEGISLNHFAAFELLTYEPGIEILKKYYSRYLDLAVEFNTGFILESPTWRASTDWGFKLGYSNNEIRQINISAIKLMRQLQGLYSSVKIVVSGNVGPRGDGYQPASCMSISEAQAYHIDQVQTFANAGADLVSAFTINYSNEAIGIVMAAKSVNMRVVISFTVETDGLLPNNEILEEEIRKVDQYSNGYVSYYMVNCAHPRHFLPVIKTGGNWTNRIGGIRANASEKSHAELDNAEGLDPGDKCLLANGYSELGLLLPGLKVVGGCCGTDHNHIEEVARSLQKQAI